MKSHSKASVHHEKVSEHARSLVRATSHIADAKVSEARERLSDVLGKARDALEYVEEKALCTAKETDQFIREKPYHAMGIAIGMGALVGFCMGRRK